MRLDSSALASSILAFILVGCFGCRKRSDHEAHPSGGLLAVKAAAHSGAPVLVPGRSIGPVVIGMSRDEAGRLGLEVRPHPSGQMGEGVRLVGPYYVVFDRDRVASVTYTLTGSRAGMVVEGRMIPETASLDDVTRAIPKCRQPELREGGVVALCGDGTTLVKTGADHPSVVEVQVVAAGYPEH